MSGRGSSRKTAGSGRTPARVRHHQGKPERDSREEQALRDGALPWLGVVIYSLGLPSWVLVLGARRRWPFLTYPDTRGKPLSIRLFSRASLRMAYRFRSPIAA